MVKHSAKHSTNTLSKGASSKGGTPKGRILVVEDDDAIALGLLRNLEFEGYEVERAADGESGLERAVDARADLIVLDVMLPRVSGYEICEALRSRGIDTPIIFLTAKVEEQDKILGLDLGGDDYITKPFSIRELIARVRTVLKRVNGDGAPPVEFGEAKVDFESQQLWVRGDEVKLTSKEFELLRFLIRSEGKVLSRETILNKVWGYDYYGTARTIDNFINRLRQKIGDDPVRPQHIVTLRGVGYKFRQ